ncbi:MAG TPA: hypothetical protein VI670_24770 [Thermoanaerobaculia bacterium]
MKASRYIFAALLLAFVSVPLAAQLNDTYVIPAAANVPGAFGTRWMTRFSVFNPQTYPLRVSVVYVPTGGGVGIEKLFDVPANAVALWDNVLRDVFGVNGSGALLVATFPEDNPTVEDKVIARVFLASTDTFNNAPSGTFGQTIPGVWAGLKNDGVTAIAHGVRNLAKEGWRANVGAVNLGRQTAHLLVSVYDFDGNTILNKASFDVPPLGHMQDGLPVQVDRGAVEFFLDDPSGTALVFPYVSMIDQFSGDPTYFSPTLLATPKYLFGKQAMAVTDPTTIGRRITTEDARRVRENAQHLGVVAVQTKAYNRAP